MTFHCELYNAALEERISAYSKQRKSISYYDQSVQIDGIDVCGQLQLDYPYGGADR